jgi:3-oxoacyl-[acyl-carrier-protein] synthase I
MTVHAVATHIVSSLGITTREHWRAIEEGRSGIERHYFSNSYIFASTLSDDQWQHIDLSTPRGTEMSRFERLAYYSARQALSGLEKAIDPQQSLFILSTTKGNIDLLGKGDNAAVLLHHSADIISNALGISRPAVTISNACASGVVALIFALRMIQSGQCRHAIVTGCDLLSPFVVSGFRALQAMSDEPCRPFDADRKGINLGEAARTIILSADGNGAMATLLSGASSNDANHISGPSRTGAELADAITRALAEAHLSPANIDMLSAHGTATLYNDEMESKAFDLAGLSGCPVHSFKGYAGHTLGAAGIIESVMAIAAMQRQQLIPSLGFERLGVPKDLNITRSPQPAAIHHVLKTSSGFGGCNAAVVFKGLR